MTTTSLQNLGNKLIQVCLTKYISFESVLKITHSVVIHYARYFKIRHSNISTRRVSVKLYFACNFTVLGSTLYIVGTKSIKISSNKSYKQLSKHKGTRLYVPKDNKYLTNLNVFYSENACLCSCVITNAFPVKISWLLPHV